MRPILFGALLVGGGLAVRALLKGAPRRAEPGGDARRRRDALPDAAFLEEPRGAPAVPLPRGKIA